MPTKILAALDAQTVVVPGTAAFGRVSPTSIVDLLWLSYGSWRESRSARSGGIATMAAWVCGGRSAPVSERTESPVSRALADAERIAAQLVLDDAAGLPRFPAEAYCAELGVAFVAPRPVEVEWAAGVHVTLRWLMGRSGVEGCVAAPIALPVRRVDGSIVSADEVYEQAVSAAVLAPLPEQRREMYRRAEADVAQSRRLDERIRSLQRAAAST